MEPRILPPSESLVTWSSGSARFPRDRKIFRFVLDVLSYKPLSRTVNIVHCIVMNDVMYVLDFLCLNNYPQRPGVIYMTGRRQFFTRQYTQRKPGYRSRAYTRFQVEKCQG